MVKRDVTIEIVSSARKRLSSMSQPSRAMVKKALSKYFTNVSISLVNHPSDLDRLVARQPDLVFLGMKYLPIGNHDSEQDGPVIWLSEYLSANHIRHTGSNHLAHQLELSKPAAKQRLINYGLATSPYQVVNRHTELSSSEITLRYPVFIKPANRGGGAGIDSLSVAYSFKQLHAKVRQISSQFQADSLLEEYLPGREFSVAILESTKHFSPPKIMPIELTPEPDKQGVRILGSEAKSANKEQVVATSDPSVHQSVSSLALKSFKALGAQGYGRIDIRMDAKGRPHFLEANLLPSLIADYGSFPKACLLNKNIGYSSMIKQIADLALQQIPAPPRSHLPLAEEAAPATSTLLASPGF